MARKRKVKDEFGMFGVGLALGLVVALVFAASWGKGEHKRGRLSAERDLALYAAAYVKTENDGLRTILTDRQAMEDFMTLQRKAYSSLLETFYKVKPRMPEGVPADPVLRKKALEYYRKHGVPWPGPTGESLEGPDDVSDAGNIPGLYQPKYDGEVVVEPNVLHVGGEPVTIYRDGEVVWPLDFEPPNKIFQGNDTERPLEEEK